MDRVVSQAAIRVAQQVIGESVPGVLAAEIKYSLGAARSVCGQQVKVIVLITGHDGVLAPDLTQADVSVDALLLEDGRIAPAVPRTNSGVAGKGDDVGEPDPLFAARCLEALDAGVGGEILFADLGACAAPLASRRAGIYRVHRADAQVEQGGRSDGVVVVQAGAVRMRVLDGGARRQITHQALGSVEMK